MNLFPNRAPEDQAQQRAPLGMLLVGAGLIDESQLDDAVREGAETGERLGELVVRRGWASEDDVARLLAEQSGLGYLDRASIWFDTDALARLSREDALQLEALPVRVEGDRVMVAVAEPTEQRLADLRRVVGEDTVVVVVAKTALDTGIDLLASRGEAATTEPADERPPERLTLAPPLEEPAEEPVEASPEPPPATNADLASQARTFADSIAAQAAALQHAEQRIETLETELSAAHAAAREARTDLAAADAAAQEARTDLSAAQAAMQDARTQLASVLALLEPTT